MNAQQAARDRLLAYLDIVVGLAAVATIPVVIAELRGETDSAMTITNWAIWLVFTLDLLVLLVFARHSVSRRTHILNAVIVVLSFPINPGILTTAGIVRIVRLVRLVRLLVVITRGASAIRVIFLRRGLLLVMLLTLAIVIIGGGVMASIEPETVRGGYWSGAWWAVVTLTTVGYGDISPATPIGRLVAVILMFTGIGLFSTLAAAVAAYFVGEDEGRELVEIEARLDRIEILLQRLTDQEPRQSQLLDEEM
jgi:voltage-gated potassium channel